MIYLITSLVSSGHIHGGLGDVSGGVLAVAQHVPTGPRTASPAGDIRGLAVHR